MENLIKNLLNKKIEELKAIHVNITDIKTLHIENVGNCSNIDNLKELKGKYVIYEIMLKENLSTEDRESLTLAFEEKRKEKTLALSRIKKNQDKENWINSQNPCLYVGSSADINSRLKGHLGFGAKKTYALHFKEWASDIKLTIEIFVFDNKKEDVQLFEDLLWIQSNPLFGRQGTL